MNYKLVLLLTAYFSIVLWRIFWPDLTTQSAQRIIGGIVPHHLYVSDIIGDFFQTISVEEGVSTIFIVGPDHLELGTSNVTFSPSFEDQSITALLPFVRSTFPAAIVTPIVMKHATTMSEIKNLVDQIYEAPGKNLLIGSIDFSHYLSSKAAKQNDLIVMDLINTRSYPQILNLNSDYLDSPGSLVAVLMYFDKYQGGQMLLLNNSNSGERGNPYSPTTSYYSLVFYGGN